MESQDLDQLQFDYCCELLYGSLQDRKSTEESPLFKSKFQDLLRSYDPVEYKEYRTMLKRITLPRGEKKYHYVDGRGFWEYTDGTIINA